MVRQRVGRNLLWRLAEAQSAGDVAEAAADVNTRADDAREGKGGARAAVEVVEVRVQHHEAVKEGQHHPGLHALYVTFLPQPARHQYV